MKSQKQAKQVKEVNVLYTYKFNKINRICFTVLSSTGQEKYNTCFDKDENHGSCTCPALRGCYHLDQLKARAAEYFASRQPAQPEPELTAEDIASLVDPDIDATYKPAKVNPVQEAQQFINRVVAEKAAKAPAPRQQEDWSTSSGSLYRETRNYEPAPSGRLVPMR